MLNPGVDIPPQDLMSLSFMCALLIVSSVDTLTGGQLVHPSFKRLVRGCLAFLCLLCVCVHAGVHACTCMILVHALFINVHHCWHVQLTVFVNLIDEPNVPNYLAYGRIFLKKGWWSCMHMHLLIEKQQVHTADDALYLCLTGV